MQPLYFTKSLFKLAFECPTKLYYFGKSEYKNEQENDVFLEALKDGGYQVGALAKAYINGGIDLQGCNNDQAHLRTQMLMQQENAIIYEALFRHENMQVRTDIVVKNGNALEVIEVKMKSYCEEKDNKYSDGIGCINKMLRNKNCSIMSNWKEYLRDVAFQSYVIEKAIPHLCVNYFLMVIDKDQCCPVDGLNQKFRILKESGKNKVNIVMDDLTPEDTSQWLLRKINVSQHIQEVKQENYEINSVEMSFDLYVKRLADSYVSNRKIISPLGGKCKSCEFKCSPADELNGLKNGFKECWKSALQWKDNDFKSKTVLDIWKLTTKDKLIAVGKVKFNELEKDDFNVKEESDSLSQSARQWLQIEKYQASNNDIFIHSNLKQAMSEWTFPSHFIDFETCTVPIPFHKGHKPYEPLAFQYSHHVMDKYGTIEHKGEFIEVKPGVFPNYEFVRKLKQELEQDDGTIFRFHNHENTILNAIYEQLKSDPTQIDDREALLGFIALISTKKGDGGVKDRHGSRSMVDLEEVLRKYTYFPATNGRTSMKVILPAVLRQSAALQEKYSKPIYGAEKGIKSLNFKSWAIVQKDDEGNVIDPYSRLPGITENIPLEDIELFNKAERMRNIEDIKEGGMASIAYALMQFTEMNAIEREAISKSLLKYCELDTLAMVLLYEYLRQIVS